MRVALSSYRSKPHSGGQGIYVRHLSRELLALGHDVTVFSGPPYPEVDAGVRLERLPSLDLYHDEHPFRRPAFHELRDPINAFEYAGVLSGTFPEPRTFGMRLKREIASRAGEFDILHDNQTLAPGVLDLAEHLPVVTTIHHPISADRRLEVAAATSLWRKYSKWRWYSFVPMQARVARASNRIITVSETSRDDIVREFRVDPSRIDVVPVGVDVDTFTPDATAAQDGTPPRLTTITSANVPLKGLSVLIDALALLPTNAWSELVVIGTPNDAVRAQLDHLDLSHRVRFLTGVSDERLAGTLASGTVHIVPSLYEGFSLPAVEAMACGKPVVATRVGALPQLLHGSGDDVRYGDAGVLVEPGDPNALAQGVLALLDDPSRAEQLGENGRRRAESTYSWRAVARATAAVYTQEIARC